MKLAKSLISIFFVIWAYDIFAQDNISGLYQSDSRETILVKESGTGLLVTNGDQVIPLGKVMDNGYANPLLGISCVIYEDHIMFGKNGQLYYYKKVASKDTQNSQKADEFSTKAYQDFQNKNFSDAISNYDKALEFENKSSKPRGEFLMMNYFGIGICYYMNEDYNNAIDSFKKSVGYCNDLNKTEEEASNYVQIGMAYTQLAQYENSIKYLKKASLIYKQLEKKDLYANNLAAIGAAYISLSQYDQALNYYLDAKAAHQDVEDKINVANDIIYIANIYTIWGKGDKVTEAYQEALSIYKDENNEYGIATCLMYMGMYYYNNSDYDISFNNYKAATAIYEKTNNKVGVSIGLCGMGSIYFLKKEYQSAIESFEQALKLSIEAKNSLQVCYTGLAQCYYALKNNDKALEYINLNIAEIGEKSNAKLNLQSNYWFKAILLYKAKNDLPATIVYLNKTLSIISDIRKTAKGDLKRDYLSSMMIIYNQIIAAYIANNQLKEAFQITENSSATYFAEQLAAQLGKTINQQFDFDNFKKKLPPQKAVIKFANMNLDNTVRLIIADDSIKGIFVDNTKFIDGVLMEFGKKINPLIDTNDKERGFVKINDGSVNMSTVFQDEQANRIKLEAIIYYYRSLLTNATSVRGFKTITNAGKQLQTDNDFVKISKLLYNFLFQDIELYLKDKNELLILPDGILAFLPFETLIMPNGKFLCEKYKITYIQSLTISEMNAKRNITQTSGVLAIGGAIYEKNTSIKDTLTRNYTTISKQVYEKLDRGSVSLSELYKLYNFQWSNLPGTLSEVISISKMLPNSILLSGSDASETNIKKLNVSGELKKYRIIHFATHGLVLPDVPELSAVVLSQRNDPQNDGYLSMSEVADLNMNCEFVNLSACETGLGKIYKGEGVVGLSQSFLLAGAKSVSVSLWSVADESTSLFMIEMYKKVVNSSMSFNEAMQKTKLEFINGKYGDIYKAPFYWAPFVIYGN